MTNNPSFPGSAWWNPAAGMEAAVQWNLMTVAWMANGWRQWMELATALASPVTPEPPEPRVATAAAPKRPAPRRAARAGG